MTTNRWNCCCLGTTFVTTIIVSQVIINSQGSDAVDQTCSSSKNGGSDGTCAASSSSSSSAAASASSQPREQLYCGLYMAESTIPGAGLGIFTTEPKEPGDVVGDGDICIPVIDMYWHNGEEKLFNPFYDYFWNGHAMGMSKETDTNDIEALCPGLDCAINCNLALINVEKANPIFDDGDLHRSVDPGVGAFSPYHNGTTIVSRAIPAGGELFKFYGDHWFTSRKHTFGNIPLSEDYPQASELLIKMMQLKIATDESKADVFRDFYEKIIVQTINKGTWETRRLNALPKDAENAKVAGIAKDVSVVYQQNATRDVKWLAENGKCIDHIRPGFSTLRQAGHGAFAKRDLPAGTVITASPVHHLPDYKFMNMYNFTHQKDESGKILNFRWYRLIDEVKQFQLFYNYCFGHPETTLLLCPYGAGVNYINHNQSQTNVRIEWARHLDMVHNESFVKQGLIEELAKDTKPRLVFDYIATRDIAEGEELFLDYGDLWENAWQKHVQTYQPYKDENYKIDPHRYASGKKWEELFGDHPLRTEAEQVHDPYPENLQMRCHRALLKKRVKPGAEYWWESRDYGLPCRILDRFIEVELNNREEILYTIQLEWRSDDAEDDDDEQIPATSKTVTWIERTDVPRSAVRFFDLPYSTDFHLLNAFRHAIQIPEAMLPDQWKNL